MALLEVLYPKGVIDRRNFIPTRSSSSVEEGHLTMGDGQPISIGPIGSPRSSILSEVSKIPGLIVLQEEFIGGSIGNEINPELILRGYTQRYTLDIPPSKIAPNLQIQQLLFLDPNTKRIYPRGKKMITDIHTGTVVDRENPTFLLGSTFEVLPQTSTEGIKIIIHQPTSFMPSTSSRRL